MELEVNEIYRNQYFFFHSTLKKNGAHVLLIIYIKDEIETLLLVFCVDLVLVFRHGYWVGSACGPVEGDVGMDENFVCL
jgi:hypothetical protein